MLRGVRPWAVWLAGLGVIGCCFAVGRALRDPEPQPPLDGTLTLTEQQKANIWAFDADNPVNGPYPGPPALLSADQRRAVESVASLASAGAETRVVSVVRRPYREAVCGLTNYQVPELHVWMVWFEGPFRRVIGSHGLAVSPYAVPSKMYLVDAETFVSQQSFAPWPLKRDPTANCRPD